LVIVIEISVINYQLQVTCCTSNFSTSWEGF